MEVDKWHEQNYKLEIKVILPKKSRSERRDKKSRAKDVKICEQEKSTIW
jgi:hypothetical protein